MKHIFIFLVACSILMASNQPGTGPEIYDSKAEAGPVIEKALLQAKQEGKHVLLDFGANWCIWCHRLHTLFTTDKAVAQVLAKDYVVVMVDVNVRDGQKRNADINAKYGNPMSKGLPVLVVLDATGKQLVTQDTGALEEGKGHSPKKVIDFLNSWGPKHP